MFYLSGMLGILVWTEALGFCNFNCSGVLSTCSNALERTKRAMSGDVLHIQMAPRPCKLLQFWSCLFS